MKVREFVNGLVGSYDDFEFDAVLHYENNEGVTTFEICSVGDISIKDKIITLELKEIK